MSKKEAELRSERYQKVLSLLALSSTSQVLDALESDLSNMSLLEMKISRNNRIPLDSIFITVTLVYCIYMRVLIRDSFPLIGYCSLIPVFRVIASFFYSYFSREEERLLELQYLFRDKLFDLAKSKKISYEQFIACQDVIFRFANDGLEKELNKTLFLGDYGDYKALSDGDNEEVDDSSPDFADNLTSRLSS